MTQETKTKLLELCKQLFKELYRVYAVSVVVLSPYLLYVFKKYLDTGEWTFDYRIALVITAIGLLKGFDRGLHESGIAEKGLVRY